MLKSKPPTTFGVFKPVGHTVIAFINAQALEAAQAQFLTLGFAPSTMVQYSAEEMVAQVEAELSDVNPVANFGYEIDLVRVHGDLAQQGCSFLVVEAPTDALSALVGQTVRTFKPASAQHYGRFMIEDLTEAPPGRMKAQVEHSD